MNITVPALGESITEGVLSRWLVADGAAVGADTPVYELETDKITTEVRAGAAGVIMQQAKAGDTVAVGAVVATLAPGEAGAAPSAASAPVAAKPAESASPGAKPGPAAQKALAESGVPASAITGTGKDGRITKGDVLAVAKPAAAPSPAAVSTPAPVSVPASASPTPTSGGGTSRKKMTPLRARIAQRLVESKNTTAMLTTFNEVDMSAVMALRAKWKVDFEKKHGVGLGFMSFFTAATVQALTKYPLLNSQIDGGDVVSFDGVHLGVAVGTEKGLVVPVLRHVQKLSLAQIEKSIKEYALKAKEGKLTLEDMTGGTFTITNGGVYGSLMSTPIINPPQSGILGMHAIKERAIVVDGQVVARPMMYLALSYDHRIVDGAEAVGFLVRIKELIEAPERLVLGL